jgi:hypothetical protein
MEMLFIVVGILVVLWLTGMLKPLRVVSSSLEEAAIIGERQMALANQSHKAEVLNKYAQLEVSDTTLAKALANKQVLSSFDI